MPDYFPGAPPVARQPAPRPPGSQQPAPRQPASPPRALTYNQQSPRGGGIYLPPQKDILNAPKPPPFGQREVAAQPEARPPVGAGVVARGQSPGDDAPIAPPRIPVRISMPSREELGLLTSNHSPPVCTLDWNTVRQQLEGWQATSYRLEKTADGQFRFVCALPYPQSPGRQRQFEATAASESDALKLALEQAQAWRQVQQ
jgi:hypothetical protein